MDIIDFKDIRVLKDHNVHFSETVSKIWDCFINSGFLQIINHGINQDVLRDTYSAAEIFFTMPLEKKLKCIHLDKARRGYSPVSTENFGSLNGDENQPNDLVEKFRMGPIEPVNFSNVYHDEDINTYLHELKYKSSNNNNNSAYAMNNWEHAPELFKERLETYYHEVNQLSLLLLKIIAIGGGLDSRFFENKMNPPTSILTLNNYPVVTGLQNCEENTSSSSSQSIIRVAEHTDVSLITIVSQSGPGLEIFDYNKKEWICIPYVSNEALIVNIGDCLSEWSHGMLKSTHHRVVEKYHMNNIARSSLAFFVSPSMDAVMNWPLIANENENNFTDNQTYSTYTQWRKGRIRRAMKLLKTQKNRK